MLTCDCETATVNHKPICPAYVTIDQVSINASLKRDPERWIEGYVTQNTENVRKRVLATMNGGRLGSYQY